MNAKALSIRVVKDEEEPDCLLGCLHRITLCAEATDWLFQEWPSGVIPVEEFWAECNVPQWMMYILYSIGKCYPETMPEDTLFFINLLDDEISYVDGTEPREELADALREIFPLEFIRSVVSELVSLPEYQAWCKAQEGK